ncbi:hypothetical protein PLEOSDRAFT_1104056 [Pleurotus ostreatus PC15]|uniref:Uncharacterized protein n=1 Tax=Pleurotus ostreatus (strain PC15) TaxID=1137138 RepID=A0A067NUU1_PLEO1|nr:hypothetical protein PLEOSDRAFT_1106231 [Pleurotus ostreatus PC15]KDQ27366.1 hypothetical protein PLEOSDRAFT_1104056 [Pleurotus ostreatus PC15]
MSQQYHYDDGQHGPTPSQTGSAYNYGTSILSRSNSENIPPLPVTPPVPNNDQVTIELKSFCDLVSNTLRLTTKQQSDLRSLVSFFPMINRHDLQVRIFQQASVFQLANDISALRTDYASLRPLIEDLRNRINTAFTLSKDQIEQVLVLAKDFVFKPNRMKYMDIMHHEMETYIKAKAQSIGMADIFGEPAREKVLREMIKSKASNARAQLRARVVDTIDGPKKCPLDQAAVLIAEKLKQGGPGIKLKVEYILRTAMFRRFAYDEYVGPAGAVGTMFDEDIEDTASEDALNAQGKRIKLASTPGKLKKGDDFWSRFDTYLAGKITLYGKDLTGEAWNGYFNELIAKDIKQWGGLAGTSRAEPLPITLTQPPQVLSSNTTTAGQSTSHGAIEHPLPPSSGMFTFGYPNDVSGVTSEYSQSNGLIVYNPQ